MGNDHFDGLRIPQARKQRDLHCEVSEGRPNTRTREYVLLRVCQRLAGSMTAVCWKPELAHHTDTYPYSFSSKNNTRHKSCMHKSAMVIVRRRRSELSRWERCQLQRRHLDMVVEACSEVFQLMREDPDQFCGNVVAPARTPYLPESVIKHMYFVLAQQESQLGNYPDPV